MTTTEHTPTSTGFASRIPFGSLTTRGVFDRFENWRGKTHAVFKTRNCGTVGWPVKGEILTALDEKLIGGEYVLDKVQLTTAEELEKTALATQNAIAAFYLERPDLLND